jgi:hypothetical protein
VKASSNCFLTRQALLFVVDERGERAGNEDLSAVDADQRHFGRFLLSQPPAAKDNARAFAGERLAAEHCNVSVFG